jgi:uncharacterized membrane protein YvlD (DUF360 family)
VTAAVYPGLSLPANLGLLLWAGLVLTLLQLLVTPVIKLILLPLNLLTLGLTSWLNQALVLMIAVYLLPELKVQPVSLPALSYGGFAVPGFHLNAALSLIVASWLFNAIYNCLDWVLCRY